MIIGIPKEILAEERRISLTAQGVYSLAKEGHKVYIEKGAGIDSRFSDDDFQKVGGEIVFSHEEVFKRSDLIVKVMPPTEEETQLLHAEQMIFSFLLIGLPQVSFVRCQVPLSQAYTPFHLEAHHGSQCYFP